MKRVMVKLAVVVATTAAMISGGSLVAQATGVTEHQVVTGEHPGDPGDAGCWDWQLTYPPVE